MPRSEKKARGTMAFEKRLKELNPPKWHASDIMDDGRIGIVTEDETIVGWGSGLSWENANKICDAHNKAIGR